MGGGGGSTCIPEEVQLEIEALIEEMRDFLGKEGERMGELMWRVRVERLVINGHIPLPCTAMEAARFLGNHDTTSLLRKGTDEG